MMKRTHWASWVLAALVLLTAPPLRAQDDSTRAAARALGTEGVEAYQAGDYATAVKKLQQAYSVLRVPSLALWLGRARAQSGQLVEAAELLLEATRLEASGTQVAVQRQAQADAEREHEALRPRIPTLLIEVKGTDPSQVKVDVNGVVVPSALLGAKRPTNPGSHTVTVRNGGQQLVKRITLSERSAQEVAFDFSDPAQTGAMGGAQAGEAPAGAESSSARSATLAGTSGDVGSKPGRTQRTLGFVALGVGGAGLIVGGIFGGVALSQMNTLEGQCPRSTCPPRYYSDLDQYDRMRLISTTGFIVGAVGAAAGVTLLLTAPKATQPDQTTVAGWVGLGGAGIQGSF